MGGENLKSFSRCFHFPLDLKLQSLIQTKYTNANRCAFFLQTENPEGPLLCFYRLDRGVGLKIFLLPSFLLIVFKTLIPLSETVSRMSAVSVETKRRG